MKTKNTKVIILDFDGVIIDSSLTVWNLLNQIRKERNMKPISLKSIVPFISYGGRNLVSHALDLSENNEIDEYVKRFRNLYMNTKTNSDILYPNVLDFLERAKKNKIKLCLCTNKPRVLTEKIINEINLTSYFDFIIAGGDLRHKKPHPENINVCLQYFGVAKDEVKYIGDSKVDEDMTTQAQVPFYFFTSGYNDGVDKGRAKFVFNNFSQLISFLKI